MTDENNFIYLINFQSKNHQEIFKNNKTVIKNHFSYLNDLKTIKKLILAGTSFSNFYELVIIQFYNAEDAQNVYQNDPLIKSNLFPSSFYPFRTSLLTSFYVEQLLKPNLLKNKGHNKKAIDPLSAYTVHNSPYFLGTITPSRKTFVNEMSEHETKVMNHHFKYLKKLLKEKRLILAGPILEEGTFGILILETKTLEDARQLLENDPSVKSGIMTPQVYPFNIFLKR